MNKHFLILSFNFIFTVVATVSVGNHLFAVSASTNGSKVYVTNLGGTISMIKTVNDKITYT
jgi:hypothetical protein